MGIVEYKSLNIGYCHWFVTWEGRTISSNYSPQSLWCDLVLPWWEIGSRADRGKHWSVTSVMVSLIWSHKDGHLLRSCCVRINPGFRTLIWLQEFTRSSKCQIVQMKCGLFYVVLKIFCSKYADVLAVHFFSTRYQSWDGSAFRNA